jgi:hypothetical protein
LEAIYFHGPNHWKQYSFRVQSRFSHNQSFWRRRCSEYSNKADSCRIERAWAVGNAGDICSKILCRCWCRLTGTVVVQWWYWGCQTVRYYWPVIDEFHLKIDLRRAKADVSCACEYKFSVSSCLFRAALEFALYYR